MPLRDDELVKRLLEDEEVVRMREEIWERLLPILASNERVHKRRQEKPN